jgi:integrase
MTVAEYLKHWLSAYAKPSVSERTYERYESIVRLHLIPKLGQHKLKDLRPLHIQAYYTEALEGGRYRRPRKSERSHAKKGEEPKPAARGLSAQTVVHHHRVLREALRQAVRWQMLTVNPADAVKPPRAARRPIRVLDETGSAELLRSLERSRFHLPALLAIGTGMRRGELLGLRWQDVDLKAGKLAVRQNLQEIKAGLVFKAPKTAKGQRSVSLMPSTIAALTQHKAAQAARRLEQGPQYHDHGLVLCEDDGQPWSPSQFSIHWRGAVTALGKDVRFHDLRHTHATLLLRQGVHPKVVSERLGHATVGITLDTYSHVLPDMQDEAVKLLDGALTVAISQAGRGAS